MSQKWVSNHRNVYLYNKNKNKLKKRASVVAASWHTLSNKKKYLALSRTVTECRWRCVVELMFWEKRETSFWKAEYTVKNVFFNEYFCIDQWWSFNCFFIRSAVESSTKSCKNKSKLTSADGSFDIQNEKYTR
jgi:hypothetical protein